ncbi:endonuclease V [candidate division KSB1 bacterium]
MNKSKLKLEQIKLAEKVLTNDVFDEINYIGGCDQAFTDDNKIISSVVVLDKNMKVIDSATAVVECKMPYIPGYLFYREAPAILEAFNKLKQKPDILIVDSNGILHPRRIGMASHVGVVLDIPTIGVAKNLMMGRVSDGKIEVDKEIRAVEVRTREHAKPLFVSPGHKISLRTAVELVKKSIIHPHKLPEQLHLAHRFANKKKKNMDGNSFSKNDGQSTETAHV